MTRHESLLSPPAARTCRRWNRRHRPPAEAARTRIDSGIRKSVAARLPVRARSRSSVAAVCRGMRTNDHAHFFGPSKFSGTCMITRVSVVGSPSLTRPAKTLAPETAWPRRSPFVNVEERLVGATDCCRDREMPEGGISGRSVWPVLPLRALVLDRWR